MKAIILVATLFGMTVFADVKTSKTHMYSDVLGQIALENACITDTEVRTIKPVRVCTQWEEMVNEDQNNGPYVEYACARTAEGHLSSSRTFFRNVCVAWNEIRDEEGTTRFECAKQIRATKAEVLPSTIIVTVWYEGDGAPTDKPFTFPTCK